MPLSLPADPPTARSLTGVVPDMLAALSGRSPSLMPARSAVLMVVDGLGRLNLSARAGHARFLSGRMTKKDHARSVFPSTTATALTSLLTGTDAGEHGIVGYRVRIPGTDDAPNQLKGWETHGLDPLTWQRALPLLEREALDGRPVFVVSRPGYAGTGFTRAIQRGAQFVGADSLDDRVETAAELTGRHDNALVYLYTPELDATGHAHGWESDAWSDRLEAVDAAARRLEQLMPADVGALLTADHGMVDVPRHRQVLLGEGDALLEDVEIVAGEPRMLHLYTAADASGAVRDRWERAEGQRSWVLTRGEAIEAGLFGTSVAPEVAERIGDVLVAARASIAYYDDREADKKAQNMVGQHGSLTDQERLVPLIRMGAFAPEA